MGAERAMYQVVIFGNFSPTLYSAMLDNGKVPSVRLCQGFTSPQRPLVSSPTKTTRMLPLVLRALGETDYAPICAVSHPAFWIHEQDKNPRALWCFGICHFRHRHIPHTSLISNIVAGASLLPCRVRLDSTGQSCLANQAAIWAHRGEQIPSSSLAAYMLVSCNLSPAYWKGTARPASCPVYSEYPTRLCFQRGNMIPPQISVLAVMNMSP